VLAWEVRLNGEKADQTPTEMRYFVDAKSGKVLDAWDEVHTADAVGTGNTITLGAVSINTNSISGGYELRDNTAVAALPWTTTTARLVHHRHHVH